MSGGSNTFDSLGPWYTLLAFDTDGSAFAIAAEELGVPLTVGQDRHDGERCDYGAALALALALALARADQYVAWAGAATPGGVRRVLARAAGHG